MGTYVVVVLIGLLVEVMAQDYYSEPFRAIDVELPEITSDFMDDLINYLPCLNENCNFEGDYPVDPNGITPEDHKTSRYLSFCIDFMEKKYALECKYPDLKALKSKLLAHLKQLFEVYEHQSRKRKDVILHVITEFIQLLYKLKARVEEWIDIPEFTEIPQPVEEIVAEVDPLYPGFVGSVRGIPGVHYPNYTEVPITSFSCADKKYIPGFYADLETGCQVFHVCYEHRRESFLCPVGTTFNQPILACDYWYSSNCSISSHYYDVNFVKEEVKITEEVEDFEEIITSIIEQEKPVLPHIHVKSKETDFKEPELQQVIKFLPVKAKVVELPVKSKPIAVPLKPIPVLDPKFIKPEISVPAVKLATIAKAKIATTPILKAKLAAKVAGVSIAKAAAVPVVKAKVAAAAAVPIVKTKVVAAAVPVAKAKVVAAAVPVVKAKVAAIPIVKAKIATAAAVPVVKAKVAVPVVKAKVAVPLFKAKTIAKGVPIMKAAAIPLKAKVALAGAPILKTKVMISPLTKKTLALGYMKLLKAKKLALLG